MRCAPPGCRRNRNGFSGGFRARPPPPGIRKSPVSARNRSPRRSIRPRSAPSQRSCVEPLDLASVSAIVRSVSNNVRRTAAPVSINVRRKPPLIARRAVHHCAPLQVGILGRWRDKTRNVGLKAPDLVARLGLMDATLTSGSGGQAARASALPSTPTADPHMQQGVSALQRARSSQLMGVVHHAVLRLTLSRSARQIELNASSGSGSGFCESAFFASSRSSMLGWSAMSRMVLRTRSAPSTTAGGAKSLMRLISPIRRCSSPLSTMWSCV